MPVPAAEPDVVLEMEGISKDFAGGRVLFDVNVLVKAGEVRGLVGQNGAGKSTLMKILAGVFTNYGGTVRIRGNQIALTDPRIAIREGVAVIYQDFTLVPEMTVAQNIVLGREPGPGPLVDARASVEQARREAERLGIDLPLGMPVKQLGVAAQQLTEIVKAVSRNARILVMDEPTARISGRERAHLFRTIRDLARAGVAIIYISHFLEEIFEVTDRVTVLRDGRVVAEEGTAALDLPALTRLVVGSKYREVSQRRAPTVADGVPALRIRNLVVPGRIESASFDMAKGEILGLAGLVGSRRTTLARALVGLEADATGGMTTSTWNGGLPRDPGNALRAGILLLAEDRKRQGLVLVRSMGENIALTALGQKLSGLIGVIRRSVRRQLIGEVIRRLGIRPANPDVPAASLSGGNQQKVLFGRAIAAAARVLILDQPTAGVDVGAKADLYEQIDRLAADGTAIVLISDDLDEILHLSDRVIVMTRGRLHQPVAARSFERHRLLEAVSGGPIEHPQSA